MIEDTDSEKPRRGVEAIFEALRDRVCLHDYPPLTVLREGELALEFGVSRTPVREALQRLAALGLVEVRNGVGTVVTALTREQAVEIYEMRLKIAELIGQLSPRPVGAAELAEIRLLAERAEALTRRPDARSYFEINHAAHFLVARIIGNAALREAWVRLYFQAVRVWYGVAMRRGEEVAASLARELREVEAAMAEDDAMAVGYIQRNYIAYGLRRVKAESWADGSP